MDENTLAELSAITNGGRIAGFNDAHYGNPWVIDQFARVVTDEQQFVDAKAPLEPTVVTVPATRSMPGLISLLNTALCTESTHQALGEYADQLGFRDDLALEISRNTVRFKTRYLTKQLKNDRPLAEPLHQGPHREPR